MKKDINLKCWYRFFQSSFSEMWTKSLKTNELNNEGIWKKKFFLKVSETWACWKGRKEEREAEDRRCRGQDPGGEGPAAQRPVRKAQPSARRAPLPTGGWGMGAQAGRRAGLGVRNAAVPVQRPGEAESECKQQERMWMGTKVLSSRGAEAEMHVGARGHRRALSQTPVSEIRCPQGWLPLSLSRDCRQPPSEHASLCVPAPSSYTETLIGLDWVHTWAKRIMRNAGWRKHRLESSLSEEASETPETQRAPPWWQRERN